VISGLASRLLSALLALLLAVVVLGLWLLATPAGSAWLIGTLSTQTDGMLSISGLHGSLLRGLRAERVEIQLTRTRVVISQAEVSVFLARPLRSACAPPHGLPRCWLKLVDVHLDEPDTPVMALLLPVW
jgi:uncharacterized protein YjeT (DUF2065 family)